MQFSEYSSSSQLQSHNEFHRPSRSHISAQKRRPLRLDVNRGISVCDCRNASGAPYEMMSAGVRRWNRRRMQTGVRQQNFLCIRCDPKGFVRKPNKLVTHIYTFLDAVRAVLDHPNSWMAVHVNVMELEEHERKRARGSLDQRARKSYSKVEMKIRSLRACNTNNQTATVLDWNLLQSSPPSVSCSEISSASDPRSDMLPPSRGSTRDFGRGVAEPVASLLSSSIAPSAVPVYAVPRFHQPATHEATCYRLGEAPADTPGEASHSIPPFIINQAPFPFLLFQDAISQRPLGRHETPAERRRRFNSIPPFIPNFSQCRLRVYAHLLRAFIRLINVGKIGTPLSASRLISVTQPYRKPFRHITPLTTGMLESSNELTHQLGDVTSSPNIVPSRFFISVNKINVTPSTIMPSTCALSCADSAAQGLAVASRRSHDLALRYSRPPKGSHRRLPNVRRYRDRSATPKHLLEINQGANRRQVRKDLTKLSGFAFRVEELRDGSRAEALIMDIDKRQMREAMRASLCYAHRSWSILSLETGAVLQSIKLFHGALVGLVWISISWKKVPLPVLSLEFSPRMI
ncbi:uncharacterized protein MYCFIDRAFT_180080 [Pseudocercospora fijiensis CIRAD86]|uniref:Uncharacterized protein n=1 Tax=Pseudocercospora fijiensis (strain CIRAD86) TaxID=383855 RepID=M3AJ46_PSEFD|nr:uncharacterized protein MYCFIDRAFT_180080 [Pseudocercospora fijiensis CIRAD86]EME77203.1 hypothetical protein MYCFIDRAFT_180080 [Pseudocercospora fijiensis CIRAD86]